jgi:hypothetical protein
MSCCGKKRAQWAAEAERGAPVHSNSISVKSHPVQAPDGLELRFEYMGSSRLTVTGVSTRQQYHFDSPGAKIAVDPADAPALRGEADLRVVRMDAN